MNPQASTPPGMSGGGASVLRTAIIACTASDMGACIMCAVCGHIFAPSRPLSDESEPIDNTDLARALWGHMCALRPVPAKPLPGYQPLRKPAQRPAHRRRNTNG